MKYRPRSLESRVCEALALSPVVFLNGARQAGKSTLVHHLARTRFKADYVTFDDVTAFAAAANDPEGFLRNASRPLIIDEVQLVPTLFRVLKRRIDELRRDGHATGCFLLTGSANVLALPELASALVGRMMVQTLHPLSASETVGHGSPVINGLFDQDLPRSGPADRDRPIPLGKLVSEATFPEISGLDIRSANLWFDGYLTTLLQRDVRQLAQIENLPALPNIVKVLATRAAGLLNDADSARDAKLNAMTYRRYRILLDQLFLIALVPPWFRNVGKRLVKSPKLYFIDTGMLCHQLGVSPDAVERRDAGLFGRLLENFVATELIKQVGMILDASLHHFRTHDGHEVDFVIERRDGTLVGIEVKSRQSVTADDFAGLKVLKDQAGPDFRRGIVLYRGREAVAFGDDMVALPIEFLWRLEMGVTTDKDVRKASGHSGYMFWADYGERTRVRCMISRETIEDHFHDRATEPQALAAIRKHWPVIWSSFVRKITEGQIEFVRHGPQFVGGRYQTIRQVTLLPQDFGSRDFRKA